VALAAAVRSVLDLNPAPTAVLVSGDLVVHAGAREYERVRELLAPLPMPVYVLAGNHDDRDALREYFALANGSTGGVGEPFRYTARVGELRLIVCDSTMPGHEEGLMDVERRVWLEGELATEPAIPTIVAMHHPPLLTGMPAFDAIGLPEVERLAIGDLVDAHPQVMRVVAGHVHRAIFGTVGRCGVVVCPSTHLQAPLEIGTTELSLVHERPAFALHSAVDGGVASHIQPIG
jgi:3',5'-cyclic-AMP phosphodiesterase